MSTNLPYLFGTTFGMSTSKTQKWVYKMKQNLMGIIYWDFMENSCHSVMPLSTPHPLRPWEVPHHRCITPTSTIPYEEYVARGAKGFTSRLSLYVLLPLQAAKAIFNMFYNNIVHPIETVNILSFKKNPGVVTSKKDDIYERS